MMYDIIYYELSYPPSNPYYFFHMIIDNYFFSSLVPLKIICSRPKPTEHCWNATIKQSIPICWYLAQLLIKLPHITWTHTDHRWAKERPTMIHKCIFFLSVKYCQFDEEKYCFANIFMLNTLLIWNYKKNRYFDFLGRTHG